MDFAVILDPESPTPLFRQLSAEWRQAVLTCRFAPGERVPSTRGLAELLGVSRTTVTQAYDELLAEGYFEARRGSGTYVCRELPERMLHARPGARKPETPPSNIRLSAYGRRLTAATGRRADHLAAHKAPAISFAHWTPDPRRLPLPAWQAAMTRALRESGPGIFDYQPDPGGYLPLREALASHLAKARGVRARAEDVVIVNGSQQAIDLSARLLVDPGDVVAFENPGYRGARLIFESWGARLAPAPVDSQGVIVSALPEEAKAIYITPSHQFPTGCVMSLARRLELIEWARRTGAAIIEDDYDSEFRYAGRPLPALQGIAGGANVIYLCSFSKVLFPGLRVGYMVAPHAVLERVKRAKWLVDRQTAWLEQVALAHFIADGHMASHIRRMRVSHGARRRALMAALDKHLAGRVRVMGDAAGLHVLIELLTDLDEQEVVRRAGEQGLGLMAASLYYLKPTFPF
ncbi:MAG: PLP-dependent aminotransferase family protein [Acidobacteria bacterium]|nr:PLP-dependent aminotransferase family protein [Acidobacteriota bacterium]